MNDTYYIYMLRCKNNAIYTGITKDIKRRMNEHFEKDKKAAKYTKVMGAKKLETYFKTNSRQKASKLEYHIKKLSKKQKEEFILDKNFDVFNDKINKEDYK